MSATRVFLHADFVDDRALVEALQQQGCEVVRARDLSRFDADHVEKVLPTVDLAVFIWSDVLHLPADTRTWSFLDAISRVPVGRVAIVVGESEHRFAELLRGTTAFDFVLQVDSTEETLPIVLAAASAAPWTHTTVPLSYAADRPALQDTLGFAPYVRAVGEFLTSSATYTPLTMSIEGPWGCGKSSFMRQLQRQLAARGSKTVFFNAWEHDQQEQLWTGFAFELFGSIRRATPLLDRPVKWVLLAWRRLRAATPGELLHSIILICVAVAAVAVTFLLIAGANDPQVLRDAPAGVLLAKHGSAVASVLGVVLVALYVFGSFHRTIFDHIESEIRRFAVHASYGERLGMIHRLHRDIRDFLDAYVEPDERIFAFVDDLDRCDVTRTTTLMRTVNLLLSDDPRLVFLFAVDRPKIIAGFAVQFAEHSVYLVPCTTELEQRNASLVTAAEYVERFVQVPFRVPVPSPSDCLELLRPRVLQPPEPREDREINRNLRKVGQRVLETAIEERRAEREQQRQINPFSDIDTVDVEIGDRDALPLLAVIEALIPALDANPRRVKQFSNLLRLRTLVASGAGAFKRREGVTPLTLWHVGKFVALEIRWPALVEEMRETPGRIAALEEAVRGGTAPALPYPRQLVHVLECRCGARPGAHDHCSFKGIDLAPLLHIGPRSELPREMLHRSFGASGDAFGWM